MKSLVHRYLKISCAKRVNEVNVLFLVSDFEPNLGGAERALVKLCEGLTNRGHNFSILNLVIFTKGCFEKKYNISNIWSSPIGFRSFKVTPSYFLAAFQKLKDARYDVIYCHHYYSFSALCSILLKKTCGIPVVVKPIGPVPAGRRVRNLFDRSIGKFVLQNSDKVVPTSPFESSYYIETMRIRSNSFDVVPSGIDSDLINQPGNGDQLRAKLGLSVNDAVILYVGSITPYKGTHVLLKSFRNVLKTFPSARLVIAGKFLPLEKGYENEILSLIDRLDLKKSVFFLGYLRGQELRDAYSAATIFVNPSLFDVTPLTVREAQSAGVPIIATNVGAVNWMMGDGTSGLLVKPNDDKELTQSMIRLLNDPNLRNKFGKNGKDMVKGFTWQNYVERTVSLLEEISKNRNLEIKINKNYGEVSG